MKTKSYYPHAPKNRDPDAQHKKPAAAKPEAKRRGAKPGVRPTAR
jgi:hypothetical protein